MAKPSIMMQLIKSMKILYNSVRCTKIATRYSNENLTGTQILNTKWKSNLSPKNKITLWHRFRVILTLFCIWIFHNS
uniref:Uncharacterized protein n=1 Tax=Lepeophtheirus salmonis TaxID=72036 RepID=A0A0K2TMB8_LEPSM